MGGRVGEGNIPLLLVFALYLFTPCGRDLRHSFNGDGHDGEIDAGIAESLAIPLVCPTWLFGLC